MELKKCRNKTFLNKEESEYKTGTMFTHFLNYKTRMVFNPTRGNFLGVIFFQPEHIKVPIKLQLMLQIA